MAWRTSSHSGANGECVEVAPTHDAGTAIRDSKEPTAGHLSVSAASWAALTAGLSG